MATRKTNTKGNKGTKNEMIEAMIKLNKSSKDNTEQKEIILNNFMNAQEIGGKVFLYIPLKYLKVDQESYQRTVYKHAQKIAEVWDIRKCDPLIVNYRKDGFFYIIDGQHRYRAALIKGILCLVCVVFVGLSVEEESEIFSDVNILSKKLIPYETFKSNICHGEQIDTIKNVCDKYGIAVEKNKSPKTLRCITLCRKIVKKDLNDGDGTESLDWIFELLGECNWSTIDPKTYTHRVFAALEHVRLANMDSLDYVKDKLVSAFDIVSYEDLSAFANLEYPLYGKDSGFIMVIKDLAEGNIEVTDDIKNMMDYFKAKGMWHWYLAFNFGLLLGRRVSDTLSLTWDNFFYENGRMRDETDIKEWKTGKAVRLYVCEACKEALKLYIDKTGADPMNNYHDLFWLLEC